jgi:hypothetical protein
MFSDQEFWKDFAGRYSLSTVLTKYSVATIILSGF